jgi:Skp family chaperone for outer membrane proteins
MHMRARELLVEEMVANLDQIIMRRHGEIQAPMRERVRNAVRTVRQREGFDIVLDLASENTIVDADPRINLTAAILRELRGAPKK